jgi:hypothetical protein
MAEGVKKVSELIMKAGRTLVLTDSTIDFSKVPVGTILIDPQMNTATYPVGQGGIKVKYNGAVDWALLDPTKMFNQKSITGSLLADKTVGSAQIADEAIATAKLGNGSVSQLKLASNSVGAAQLFNGVVTTDKLGDKSVKTAKIDDSAIGAMQMADGAVIDAKLATDSVITVKIKNAAVTGLKIADGSISYGKFDPTTKQLIDSTIKVQNGVAQMNGNFEVTGNITATGNITGARVFNAVYGDLAEGYVPETEEVCVPGYIVEVNNNGNVSYASEYSRTTVGVISDCYASCFQASQEELESGEKVAVALVGKVPVYIYGKVKRGDMITTMCLGIGTVDNNAPRGTIVGKALEDKDTIEKDLVLCLISPM